MHFMLSALTRPTWIRIVSLALWLGVVWQSAAAQLPGAVGTFNTNVSTNVFVFPASASFACGSASITAVPLPTLSVSGTNCPDVLQAILSYSVRINGRMINSWTDTTARTLSGYIGLQNYNDGKTVRHRNLRVKEVL